MKLQPLSIRTFNCTNQRLRHTEILWQLGEWKKKHKSSVPIPHITAQHDQKHLHWEPKLRRVDVPSRMLILLLSGGNNEPDTTALPRQPRTRSSAAGDREIYHTRGAHFVYVSSKFLHIQVFVFRIYFVCIDYVGSQDAPALAASGRAASRKPRRSR